ncbi:ybhS, partial [Symbiodinium sp. CCMP2456]
IALHREYTPGGRTSTNIVPELLAIILSMTIVMITAVAIVKERERGIMEMLIFTPVRPAEVMLGKILPYVLVGYVQTAVFMPTAFAVFNVPFTGSFLAFFYGFNLFVLGNLALGFLISTLASNQMQAIGTAVSATHFIQLIRKVMLKGADTPDVSPELAALGVIVLVISLMAMLRYRQTLD